MLAACLVVGTYLQATYFLVHLLGFHGDVDDVMLGEHLGPVGVLAARTTQGLACKTKTKGGEKT